jgi:hypothetical protein
VTLVRVVREGESQVGAQEKEDLVIDIVIDIDIVTGLR